MTQLIGRAGSSAGSRARRSLPCEWNLASTALCSCNHRSRHRAVGRALFGYDGPRWRSRAAPQWDLRGRPRPTGGWRSGRCLELDKRFHAHCLCHRRQASTHDDELGYRAGLVSVDTAACSSSSFFANSILLSPAYLRRFCFLQIIWNISLRKGRGQSRLFARLKPARCT